MRSIAAALGGIYLLLSARAHALEHDVASRPIDDDACDRFFSIAKPKPARCLAPIETDRPHKTDSPKVLAPGHAQVEMGVLEYEVERLGGQSESSLVLMNNIYKLGVVRGVDLEVLHGAGAYVTRRSRFSLGQQMLVRSKVNIIGGDRGRFELTLVPAVVVPFARRGQLEGGGFVFVGGELPAELEFELNVGGLTERENDRGPRRVAAIVTAAVTRRIVGPLTGFVEWYNDTTTADPARWTATADTGLLFLVTKNVQLDAGSYVRLWGDAAAITPFVGVSTRL